MKAFAALFIFALCNSAILVQAKPRCWGWTVWGGCFGISTWRFAQPLNLLSNTIDKVINGSRQNVANLPIDNIDLGDVGSIQDVTLRNLETFQVVNLELGNVLALQIKNLSVKVDLLNIDGSYDLINLNIPSVGDVSGKGKFSIDLTNVHISAAISLKSDGIGKVVVKDISDITVTVDAALAVLEGVEGGDVVNSALSAVIPDAVREALPQILENNKQTLINFLNNSINNIV